MLLSQEEIKKITNKFLEKYSKKLECKVYKYDEFVRRQGEKTSKIYIVKDGVFKIGKIDSTGLYRTLNFCFKLDVISRFAMHERGIT
jgi:CRP-like cAMP-binding protein